MAGLGAVHPTFAWTGAAWFGESGRLLAMIALAALGLALLFAGPWLARWMAGPPDAPTGGVKG